jgi:hypothetical protein
MLEVRYLRFDDGVLVKNILTENGEDAPKVRVER